MTLRRLSGLDAAFLSAENPETHMHLLAIMLLEPSTIPGGYSFERLRQAMGAGLHLIPPMRRRLVEVPLGIARPYWLELEDVDIEHHVHRAAVPSPGGPRELGELAGEINSRQLDRAHPLWEIHLVEGLEDGSVALIAKIHHALMDGIAGMSFLSGLVSGEPEPLETRGKGPKTASPEPAPGDVELLLRSIPELAWRPWNLARVGAGAVRAWLGDTLRPGARDAEPERQPTPRTIFNQPISADRSIAYTSLPLERVKQIGRRLDATVNEVVLAVVAGALRRELIGEGESVDEPLVAGIPVSTHAEKGDDLTNAYGVIFGSLATDVEDPIARLSAIKESSRREKRRRSSSMSDALLELTDVLWPNISSLITAVYFGLDLPQRLTPVCNVVVSNIPGPQKPIYFLGARVKHIHPIGPIMPGMTINITLISVSGSIDIGLSGCRHTPPDLWSLAGGIADSLDELTALAAGTAEDGGEGEIGAERSPRGTAGA